MTDEFSSDQIRMDQLDNYVQPFRIEGTDVRGQVVQLGSSLDSMLCQHDHPLPVLNLLGECAVLATMLGSTIKFDGRLTLQAQGSGPVKLLIVDYVSDGSIRCFAQVNAEEYEEAFGGDANNPDQILRYQLSRFLGKGHLAITIDQGADMERYQGIVEITGASVADAALTYFAQSEQTLTAIRLGVGRIAMPSKPDAWRGGGIMIQRLPEIGGQKLEPTHNALDDWERLSTLLNTTQDDELIDAMVGADRLLFRLFHEERVRLFDAREIEFSCRCNRERIENLLKTFGYAEVQDLIVDGKVEVRCEFCNGLYEFDQVDLLKLGLAPKLSS